RARPFRSLARAPHPTPQNGPNDSAMDPNRPERDQATDQGDLQLTGERTTPGIPAENYWFRRHEAAYRFASSRLAGRVLDVGCGEGYGASMLAASGHSVVAVELDPATASHA